MIDESGEVGRDSELFQKINKEQKNKNASIQDLNRLSHAHNMSKLEQQSEINTFHSIHNRVLDSLNFDSNQKNKN